MMRCFKRCLLFLFLVLAVPPGLHAGVLEAGTAEWRIARLCASPELSAALAPSILRKALRGYFTLKREGKITREGILTVIDFNRPSDENRLFVIDIRHGRIIHADLVAHGKGSGEAYARVFSNVNGSHQSSLGFFTTGETYTGKHGYSLRLEGMEPGINDNAASRAIVMHAADYVSRAFISKHGRLGRSLGCPALPEESSTEVIDLIKGGSCLFIYNDAGWYAESSALIDQEPSGTAKDDRPYS